MEILLHNGTIAIIDDEDYLIVSDSSWWQTNGGYAQAKIDGRNISMHRLILGVTDPKKEVDHINGDRLDNRRCNLRITDRAGNAKNRAKSRTWQNRPVVSKYKGVFWHNERQTWQAKIRNQYLGLYETEELAALSYDCAAVKLFGEFARLNFPDTSNYASIPRRKRRTKKLKPRWTYGQRKRPSENHLTVKEASVISGITRQRIHQLLSEGKLTGMRVDKTVYVDRNSLVERYQL